MSVDQVIACQKCQTSFKILQEDFGFYTKINVPPPALCPDCRRQRREAWKNDIHFFRGTCGLTGKSVISRYRPDSGIPVYAPRDWHGDNWDAMDYGRDYDWGRPFFEQYVKLLRSVPKPALDNDDGVTSVNCEYTNDFAMSKNCYLTVKAWKLEDVSYSFYVIDGKDLLDVHTSFGRDQGNYETVNTQHCYECRYVYDSQSCSNCMLCYDCRGCNFCFMCTGLRNKSYCFQNQEVGKERYQEIIAEYQMHTYSGTQRALAEFAPIMQQYPRRATRMVNCNDCLGDLVYDSNDCQNCFVVANSEHYRYGMYSDGVRDSYDTDAGGGSELAYESIVSGFCSRVIGCFWVWNSTNLSYVEHSYRCHDLFACASLKDKQYCILNKQYTESEYRDLSKRIRQHMDDMPYVDATGAVYRYGDYAPMELSYFPYNDTPAQHIYPLDAESASVQGLFWADDSGQDNPPATLQAANLPDSIDDVADSILNEVIQSNSSERRFRLVESELQFYRRYRIPLPRESFFERHARRHKLATSYRLYERTSDKTGLPIISSYPPDAPETVWSIDEHKAEFE